jgi:hypothetical protein
MPSLYTQLATTAKRHCQYDWQMRWAFRGSDEVVVQCKSRRDRKPAQSLQSRLVCLPNSMLSRVSIPDGSGRPVILTHVKNPPKFRTPSSLWNNHALLSMSESEPARPRPGGLARPLRWDQVSDTAAAEWENRALIPRGQRSLLPSRLQLST